MKLQQFAPLECLRVGFCVAPAGQPGPPGLFASPGDVRGAAIGYAYVSPLHAVVPVPFAHTMHGAPGFVKTAPLHHRLLHGQPQGATLSLQVFQSVQHS